MFKCSCLEGDGGDGDVDVFEHSIAIVRFDVKDFKAWHKKFEKSQENGQRVEGATFVGKSVRSTGLFTTLSAAHIVHVFPRTHEGMVQAAYSENSAAVDEWIKRGLMMPPASLDVAALAYKEHHDDLGETLMVTTTHTIKTSYESWLEAVSSIEFPPSQLFVGNTPDGSVAFTVHLFNKAVDKDMKAVLAFSKILQADLVVPPILSFQSTLISKRT